VIAQFPTRDSVRYQEDDVEAFIERTGTDRDYLSLWQAKAAGPSPVPVAESEEEDEDDAPPAIEKLIALFQEIDYKKHAKWVLPAAACLLLAANIGAAIDTVKNLVTPAKPALTVEPVKIDEPFVEVIERRVGRLKLESTPSGAEAIVDGKSYGKTPLTVPDLEIGTHTLVLKSSGGSISRRVTIKANQVTLVTEAIYSGWLAIFSPIAVSVRVDGRPVTLSDDNRIMISPGKHTVEMISERFNYRETQTLEVLPGETTAHTMTAPMGNVRITAPEGTELRIDGEVPAGVPGEGIAIPIGAHEITARHPVHGERRLAVDVRHGGLNEVVVLY
jgi:hypothetical protein